MNARQENFCREYIIDCNATQAAIRSGYSAKTAKSIGQRLLTKVDIQKRIEELMNEKETKQIASADEVLRYLTSVMRGETVDEVLDKDGYRYKLKVAERDRLKAAELLGKRYMLFTDRVENNDKLTIVIEGEDELED